MRFVILLLAFQIHYALSETAVTLWEFGPGRLFPGATTEPLQAIGVASDQLSTTYLYEVLNFKATTITSNGAVQTSTITSPATRVVIASASGWIEPFGSSNFIECAFTGEGAGECFDESSTNTGTPFAAVLPVETLQSGAPAATTSFPTIETSFPTGIPSDSATSKATMSSNASQRLSMTAAGSLYPLLLYIPMLMIL